MQHSFGVDHRNDDTGIVKQRAIEPPREWPSSQRQAAPSCSYERAASVDASHWYARPGTSAHPLAAASA
jgi:hypothetical protein